MIPRTEQGGEAGPGQLKLTIVLGGGGGGGGGGTAEKKIMMTTRKKKSEEHLTELQKLEEGSYINKQKLCMHKMQIFSYLFK